MKSVQTPPETLKQTMGKIVNIISSERFPTGDRAALRRMVPGHPLPLSFYRFAFGYLPLGWEYAADDWTTLVAGIALMSPNAYDPYTSFGKALAEAGYSELRLERLLLAEYGVRRILFLRAVRFVSAKLKPFDWSDGASFLLTRNRDRQENLNFNIARDFYNIINKE